MVARKVRQGRQRYKVETLAIYFCVAPSTFGGLAGWLLVGAGGTPAVQSRNCRHLRLCCPGKIAALTDFCA